MSTIITVQPIKRAGKWVWRADFPPGNHEFTGWAESPKRAAVMGLAELAAEKFGFTIQAVEE